MGFVHLVHLEEGIILMNIQKLCWLVQNSPLESDISAHGNFSMEYDDTFSTI